jgi:hypothetical protein
VYLVLVFNCAPLSDTNMWWIYWNVSLLNLLILNYFLTNLENFGFGFWKWVFDLCLYILYSILIHKKYVFKNSGSGLFRRRSFRHGSFRRRSFCRRSFCRVHFIVGHFFAELFRHGIISTRTVKTYESHCWTSSKAGNRI